MNRLLSVLKEGWAECRQDLRRTWAALVLTVIGDEVIHR